VVGYDAWAAGRNPMGDPPEFAALSDRPALREALVLTFEEGCRWADGTRGSAHRRVGGAQFAWEVTKQVAGDVAFDRHVGIGAVDGLALVFAVEGSWWELFAPGVVLCSRAAAQDPMLARTILRSVFESGLARSPSGR
jgi:hypothetical protein